MITILVICLTLLGIILGSFFYVFGGLNTTSLPTDNDSLGIRPETTTRSGIVNIALFGVDARDGSDHGRSDAIIILSVDNEHDKIKLTSILRDSKVPIEGHGETKINHAYAYGGPTLAIKTLNQNFDLNIKEYATVNFDQMASIVDAVSGVTMELSEEEAQIVGVNSGAVLLNGSQAVTYTRIRYIDSDNARADRQKNVLTAVFEKLKTMSKADYPKFIHDFLSVVETSLSYGDLIGLSPIMLKSNLQFVQNSIPDTTDNPQGGIASDGVWYWNYDLDAASARLHQIIYETE
ncbi:MAG: LCP family protein [Bacillota bacterium]|nr:LCP family protein [Bacillota bacterium]